VAADADAVTAMKDTQKRKKKQVNAAVEDAAVRTRSIPMVEPIRTGKQAPSFSLNDKEGTTHTLSSIDADYVVLYFYPKDDTPGCTLEAQMFEKHLDDFKKANAHIIGISGGDEKSKKKFCNKYNLSLLLLSDPDFSVAKRYGVYGEKQFMGKTYEGIHRMTFVLDKDRKIINIHEKVKPKDHAQEVLDFLAGENDGTG
jgi:peroxiredoxin Q/BCP